MDVEGEHFTLVGWVELILLLLVQLLYSHDCVYV